MLGDRAVGLPDRYSDINLIIAARNQASSGPGDPRDANGNGRIDALDARTCQQRCTIAGCTAPPANRAPVAIGDTYATPEDTTLVVMGPGVLGNDTDADGNPLTAVLVTPPASGIFALNANGGFTYTPPATFNGSVSFTYRANDGVLDSNMASVTIILVNMLAARSPRHITGVGEFAMEARTLAGFAVLLKSAVVLLLLAASGVATAQAPKRCDVNADGFINITDINLIIAARNQASSGPGDPRDANGNGRIDALDARTCQQRCTIAGCAAPPANRAPVAIGDTYATPEDTTLVVMGPGVLGNDTDADGNPLAASVVTGPAVGTLVLSANGSFSYMPAPDFSGPVTFTYRANDGALNSNAATVTIDVTAQNDGPVALADSYHTAEDTPLNVPAPGVLGNDSDTDGNPLTALLVNGPPASAGTVTLAGDGSVMFTPAMNFTGAATFSYRASDGVLQSSVTTVTINVVPDNDAPVANADNYSTDEDVPLVVATPGVLGNDVDPDGSGLTVSVNTNPTSGTLVLNVDGSLTYTPASNFTGPASFTYRASDGVLNSSPATVSITVLPVNDAPVATNDSYSTSANTALNVVGPGVLGNDTDQEGAGLIAVLGTGPANGALALNANGSFSYTPNNGFTGADSFTYQANDGTLPSNLATVSITVTPAANSAPVANGDSYSTKLNTAFTVPAPGVLGNDTDPEVNALTAVLGTGPANGVLTLNANGGFTYTPNDGFFGNDSFTYRASDGSLPSNLATVGISVANVPVVTLVASAPNASEAGPVNGEFTFSRTGGNTAAALQVLFTVGGTATNQITDGDYVAISAYVYIPAGQASVTLPIAVKADNRVEGAETVILTLQPSATYSIGGSSTATVTIADNP